MSGQNNIVNRHLEIQEGTTDIGFGAFARNQLTSVTIPDSVTTIGSVAFMYNELTVVTMPSRFNTDEHKARIFGDNFGQINFILT